MEEMWDYQKEYCQMKNAEKDKAEAEKRQEIYESAKKALVDETHKLKALKKMKMDLQMIPERQKVKLPTPNKQQRSSFNSSVFKQHDTLFSNKSHMMQASISTI